MAIQLIHGQFTSDEALGLITQMIHVKIKYHENKITVNSTEEDIKNRETKIKRLQQELDHLRSSVISKGGNLAIDAVINIIH